MDDFWGTFFSDVILPILGVLAAICIIGAIKESARKADERKLQEERELERKRLEENARRRAEFEKEKRELSAKYGGLPYDVIQDLKQSGRYWDY